MQLNEYGAIAYNEWNKLSERFINFELDTFQIMPNHLHAIIVLNDLDNSNEPGKADLAAGAGVNPARTIKNGNKIGDIVGAYKSIVAYKCLEIYKLKNEIMGKLWQRNYYEHIIRNEQSYCLISDYIVNNPLNWKEDLFNN